MQFDQRQTGGLAAVSSTPWLGAALYGIGMGLQNYYQGAMQSPQAMYQMQGVCKHGPDCALCREWKAKQQELANAILAAESERKAAYQKRCVDYMTKWRAKYRHTPNARMSDEPKASSSPSDC